MICIEGTKVAFYINGRRINLCICDDPLSVEDIEYIYKDEQNWI